MSTLNWAVISDLAYGADTHQAELWVRQKGDVVDLEIDGERMLVRSASGLAIGHLEGPAARWLTGYHRVEGQTLGAVIHDIIDGSMERPGRRAWLRVWRIRGGESEMVLGTRDHEGLDTGGWNALA